MSVFKYIKKMKLIRQNDKNQKAFELENLKQQKQEKELNKKIWSYLTSEINFVTEKGVLNLFKMEGNELKGSWYFPDEIVLIKEPSILREYKANHEGSVSMNYYSNIKAPEQVDENGKIFKDYKTGSFRYEIVNKTKNKTYAKLNIHELAYVKSDFYSDEINNIKNSENVISALKRKMRKNPDEALINDIKKDFKLWKQLRNENETFAIMRDNNILNELYGVGTNKESGLEQIIIRNEIDLIGHKHLIQELKSNKNVKEKSANLEL